MNFESEMKYNVICMKWGDKYSANYVNTLYAMVCRNLTKEFRFICITDDSEGLNPAIETFPIPEFGFDIVGPERCWRKLAVFKKGFAEMEGQCLFIDLDVVVVDQIDCFFDYPHTFRLCHETHRNRRLEGNSSVMHFPATGFHFIFDEFVDRPHYFMGKFRHDQSFISQVLLGRKLLEFWPRSWTPTFKYDCVPSFPLNFVKPTFIPKGSKILLFHGVPNPREAADGISGKWYRWFRKSPWLHDYWHV